MILLQLLNITQREDAAATNTPKYFCKSMISEMFHLNISKMIYYLLCKKRKRKESGHQKGHIWLATHRFSTPALVYMQTYSTC